MLNFFFEMLGKSLKSAVRNRSCLERRLQLIDRLPAAPLWAHQSSVISSHSLFISGGFTHTHMRVTYFGYLKVFTTFHERSETFQKISCFLTNIELKQRWIITTQQISLGALTHFNVHCALKNASNNIRS